MKKHQPVGQHENPCDKIFDHKWLDPKCVECGCQSLFLKHLRDLIGRPPQGSHPDEWKPRAETWHQERLNWQSQVERLQSELARQHSAVSSDTPASLGVETPPTRELQHDETGLVIKKLEQIFYLSNKVRAMRDFPNAFEMNLYEAITNAYYDCFKYEPLTSSSAQEPAATSVSHEKQSSVVQPKEQQKWSVVVSKNGGPFELPRVWIADETGPITEDYSKSFTILFETLVTAHNASLGDGGLLRGEDGSVITRQEIEARFKQLGNEGYRLAEALRKIAAGEPDPKLKAWESDGGLDSSEMAKIARNALASLGDEQKEQQD